MLFEVKKSKQSIFIYPKTLLPVEDLLLKNPAQVKVQMYHQEMY